MKVDVDKTQVLVCQHGARRRYAVARLLEQAGCLAALYTDSSAHSTAGRLARMFMKVGVTSSRWKALASRVPQGVPKKKIFSSDCKLSASGDLAAVYKKWGLQGAEVIYSMYGEDAPFLEWAKEQGAKVLVDVFVHPSTNRIMAEEAGRFPEAGERCGNKIEAEDRHSRRAFALADLLLCPSQWVAEGVRSFAPDCADKIRIVPYGSSLDLNSTINEKSKPGRILFAGRDPLRKGLHYLAEAAAVLRSEGVELDVRVAGVSASDVEWIEHREQLNCLGTLPMNEMHREFADADIFVLPSLSEGQAGSVLEAMASGCPVVTTRESGVDFDDGCGTVVPARDVVALAATLKKLIKDRALRNEQARGALRQAGMFSMQAWKQRLVQAVNEVESM